MTRNGWLNAKCRVSFVKAGMRGENWQAPEIYFRARRECVRRMEISSRGSGGRTTVVFTATRSFQPYSDFA